MEEMEIKPEKKSKSIQIYKLDDYLISLGKKPQRFIDLFKIKFSKASKKPTTKAEFDILWKSILEDK